MRALLTYGLDTQTCTPLCIQITSQTHYCVNEGMDRWSQREQQEHTHTDTHMHAICGLAYRGGEAKHRQTESVRTRKGNAYSKQKHKLYNQHKHNIHV